MYLQFTTSVCNLSETVLPWNQLFHEIYQVQVYLRLQLTKQLRVRFDGCVLYFGITHMQRKSSSNRIFHPEFDIESRCHFVYIM